MWCKAASCSLSEAERWIKRTVGIEESFCTRLPVSPRSVASDRVTSRTQSPVAEEGLSSMFGRVSSVTDFVLYPNGKRAALAPHLQSSRPSRCPRRRRERRRVMAGKAVELLKSTELVLDPAEGQGHEGGSRLEGGASIAAAALSIAQREAHWSRAAHWWSLELPCQLALKPDGSRHVSAPLLTKSCLRFLHR